VNLIGEQVIHSKFGSGTITLQTETNIEVEFKEEYGTKKFVFPAAFEQYLTLTEPTLQSQVATELTSIENRKVDEARRQAMDAGKKRAMERQDMLAKKRAKSKKSDA